MSASAVEGVLERFQLAGSEHLIAAHGLNGCAIFGNPAYNYTVILPCWLQQVITKPGIHDGDRAFACWGVWYFLTASLGKDRARHWRIRNRYGSVKYGSEHDREYSGCR